MKLPRADGRSSNAVQDSKASNNQTEEETKSDEVEFLANRDFTIKALDYRNSISYKEGLQKSSSE